MAYKFGKLVIRIAGTCEKEEVVVFNVAGVSVSTDGCVMRPSSWRDGMRGRSGFVLS